MTRKLLKCAVCLAALCAPTFANAGQAGTWYLRGDAGIGISDFSIWGGEIAFSGGGGVGYNYNHMFRTDVTFDAAIDYEESFFGVNVSLDSYSVMANGYLDIPFGGPFTPYVGAGVGYGWVEASALGLSATEEGVAFAGMAGISYDMSQDMALDLGYKYRVIMIDGEDVDDHLIRAGIRFNIN
ncbi:MAG: porin family protein [Rhizobiales bacterium]|nr:porin family protein [Hyphomicrobiales bacterium]